jgi:leucine dehydrogenase
MTYKAAAAGLSFGGGKAVIIGDSRTQKSPALLRRFGSFVQALGGKYITAEDMGIGTADVETIRAVTPHVAGVAAGSGDPAPFTALGVFVSILAAMEHLKGRQDMNGRKVLVQGTGNVGLALVKHLRRAGADVFAWDVRESALRAAVVAGARAVPASAIHSLVVDVYAPCALGATLNPASISQLRCAAVVGAANNQLLDEERDGQALHDRGILYVPDFVANAGGIINISVEKSGAYDRELAARLTLNIQRTVSRILAESATSGILPHQAAKRLAERRLRMAAPGGAEKAVAGSRNGRDSRQSAPG